MAERFAVTGYVADSLVEVVKEGRSGPVDVKPERGRVDVLMRVDRADVDEARIGASKKGETLVQLILRDGARVETVITVSASEQGLARYYDPVLVRLTAAATVKVIEA